MKRPAAATWRGQFSECWNTPAAYPPAPPFFRMGLIMRVREKERRREGKKAGRGEGGKERRVCKGKLSFS